MGSKKDQILKKVVAANAGNWKKIAEDVPGRTEKQCRERWINHFRPDIRKEKRALWTDCIILHEY